MSRQVPVLSERARRSPAPGRTVLRRRPKQPARPRRRPHNACFQPGTAAAPGWVGIFHGHAARRGARTRCIFVSWPARAQVDTMRRLAPINDDVTYCLSTPIHTPARGPARTRWIGVYSATETGQRLPCRVMSGGHVFIKRTMTVSLSWGVELTLSLSLPQSHVPNTLIL